MDDDATEQANEALPETFAGVFRLAGGEAPALLSVNGRDVGREVMQEFLPR